jgi:hypothetical protein
VVLRDLVAHTPASGVQEQLHGIRIVEGDLDEVVAAAEFDCLLGARTSCARVRPVGEAWFGLLGVVVGGVITLLIAIAQDRSTRDKEERVQRLAAAQEVLGALQELNRRIIDLARIETASHNSRDWPELHQATIRWSSARYAATLIAPTSQIELLEEIDSETDRVMDEALGRVWASRDFRAVRERLGELGAKYLNLVRTAENLNPSGITSLWPWADRGSNAQGFVEGLRPPAQPRRKPAESRMRRS